MPYALDKARIIFIISMLELLSVPNSIKIGVNFSVRTKFACPNLILGSR